MERPCSARCWDLGEPSPGHTVTTGCLCPRCQIKVCTAVKSTTWLERPCGRSSSLSRVSWGPACEHGLGILSSAWGCQGWEGQGLGRGGVLGVEGTDLELKGARLGQDLPWGSLWSDSP